MKKLPIKYWPVIGIILILGVIFFYLAKSSLTRIEETVINTIIPEDGLKLENIHYVQDDPDEGIKWILDAGEVIYSQDREKISFKDFSLKLTMDKDSHMEFNGERGYYNKTLSEIEIWGDLDGETSEGYRIITTHLLYRENEKALRTDERVKLIGPFFTVTGSGLHFSFENKCLKILNDIKTTIRGDSFFS